MTLRVKIVEIIDDADGADPLWMVDAADAIIAAIKAHMTSPEAVERAGVAFWKDNGRNGANSYVLAAILAALGGEP